MHTTTWTVGLVIAVSAALAACGSSSDDGGPSTGGSGGAPSGGGGSGGAVQSGTQIQIESGEVDGESADGVRAFRGIPYAEPPVGPQRFQAPEKIEPWSMPFDATGTPNTCPQLATVATPSKGRRLPDAQRVGARSGAQRAATHHGVGSTAVRSPAAPRRNRPTRATSWCAPATSSSSA
ncbi:MAG: carboxylesterase family protein [Polyangiaceae bacterium]|nr:carboxylesterase family protein [Polyangiaceae bacterium]